MISAAERESILTAALTRQPFPGLRVVSPGVLAHCRTLRLSEFVKRAAAPETPEAAAARAHLELLAFAYLIDARHTLDDLDAFVAIPDAERLKLLRDYGFSIPLSLLACVQREQAASFRELAAIDYNIEEKPPTDPDAPAPPVPRGNS